MHVGDKVRILRGAWYRDFAKVESIVGDSIAVIMEDDASTRLYYVDELEVVATETVAAKRPTSVDVETAYRQGFKHGRASAQDAISQFVERRAATHERGKLAYELRTVANMISRGEYDVRVGPL
jgi:hypothetical protein